MPFEASVSRLMTPTPNNPCRLFAIFPHVEGVLFPQRRISTSDHEVVNHLRFNRNCCFTPNCWMGFILLHTSMLGKSFLFPVPHWFFLFPRSDWVPDYLSHISHPSFVLPKHVIANHPDPLAFGVWHGQLEGSSFFFSSSMEQLIRPGIFPPRQPPSGPWWPTWNSLQEKGSECPAPVCALVK